MAFSTPYVFALSTILQPTAHRETDLQSRSNPSLPAIKACLFDMDGLLIDSEDLYTICTNEILAEYGKPNLPWNIKAQLQGRPGPEAGKIFHQWAQLPISREEFIEKQSARQRKYFPSTKALPGVPALLRALARASDPHVHMALATSSHRANFDLKTKHLEDELFHVFAQDHRVLGDDPRIGKGRGKPAPDIWLVALETINAPLRAQGKEEVKPEECLVFEDSVPGVESGRRAGMQVVWCPHQGLRKEYTGREEEVLAGLTGEHTEQDERNDEIGVVAHDGSKRRKGAPGEVGDGWGRLVESLEGFPFAEYGIAV